MKLFHFLNLEYFNRQGLVLKYEFINIIYE